MSMPLSIIFLLTLFSTVSCAQLGGESQPLPTETTVPVPTPTTIPTPSDGYT